MGLLLMPRHERTPSSALQSVTLTTDSEGTAHVSRRRRQPSLFSASNTTLSQHSHVGYAWMITFPYTQQHKDNRMAYIYIYVYIYNTYIYIHIYIYIA